MRAGWGGDCWAVALCYVSCRSRLERRGGGIWRAGRSWNPPRGGLCQPHAPAGPHWARPFVMLIYSAFCPRHWWSVCVREEYKKDWVHNILQTIYRVDISIIRENNSNTLQYLTIQHLLNKYNPFTANVQLLRMAEKVVDPTMWSFFRMVFCSFMLDYTVYCKTVLLFLLFNSFYGYNSLFDNFAAASVKRCVVTSYLMMMTFIGLCRKFTLVIAVVSLGST